MERGKKVVRETNTTTKEKASVGANGDRPPVTKGQKLSTSLDRITDMAEQLATDLDQINIIIQVAQDRERLRELLTAIIEQAERGTDGDLYVRVGGGLRLLSRGMIEAIENAKRYLEQGAISR